jgi:hypothetical protein
MLTIRPAGELATEELNSVDPARLGDKVQRKGPVRSGRRPGGSPPLGFQHRPWRVPIGSSAPRKFTVVVLFPKGHGALDGDIHHRLEGCCGCVVVVPGSTERRAASRPTNLERPRTRVDKDLEYRDRRSRLDGGVRRGRLRRPRRPDAHVGTGPPGGSRTTSSGATWIGRAPFASESGHGRPSS